jgi:hypothetical protein
MDDQQVFIALLTCIGLTQARQRDAITANGVMTCTDLLLLSKKDLENVYSVIREDNRNRQQNNMVRIPISSRAKLEAVRLELKRREICNALPDADQINAIDDAIAASYIKEQAELDNAEKTTRDQLPDVGIAKLSHTNWRSFKQSVLDVLARTRGAHGIPLSYVVRDGDVGDYFGNYETIMDKLVACVAHDGMQYSTDNKHVYTFLRDKTNDTPAESTVAKFQRTSNGRAAWLALISLNESESYKRQLKSKAMSMIGKAAWHGPKKKFTLNDYYNIHVKAHNMLLEADAPLSDELKIQHFQDGIKEIRSIEQSTATLARVGDNDFAKYYRDLSSSLTSIYTLVHNAQQSRTLSDGSDSRHINQLQTSGRGRGRGHNQGRGRNQGRGCGRGRNSSNSDLQYWRPEDKQYSDEEWNRLSHGQRQAVIHFRRGIRHNTQNANNQGNDRNINQVLVDQDQQSVPSQVQFAGDNNGSQTNRNNSGTSVSGSRGNVGSAFNGNRGN